MRSSFGKALLSFLFMAAFLVPRVADLHAFDHFDEDEGVECELCHVISAENEHDLYTVPSCNVEDPVAKLPIGLMPPSSYEVPLALIASPSFIYNKPPPVL